ncbi:MAG TPA: SUMF1/EgtB/PvdO family nonheme iron enzyme, partial [Bryobacteraceae bacterium]|nr:SUMF1/EgtB/PvdO family nonheme iron enzyme [Bryobacteraceae bacterium]
IFYQILQEPLNVGPMRAAGIPEPIIDLVSRCTQKDPSMRPQGFGEVCARIQQIMQEWDAPTRALSATAPVSTQPAPRNPWLIPAVIAGMIVVLAGVYFVVRATRAPAAAPAPAVVATPKKTELARVLADPAGEMVLVPEGTFLFGEKKDPVRLPAFYIDRTEVSVAAYQAFCTASGRPAPKGARLDQPDYPVVDVSFQDAQDFAQWAHKRLPTSQEWEKAARGTDGRLYPWGEPKIPPPANVGQGTNGHVEPVTSFPDGASPFQALNMLGNVWEWVNEPAVPSPDAIKNLSRVMQPAPTRTEPWFLIRGGSYAEPLSDGYLRDTAPAPARRRAGNIGFRCARTP